MPELGPDPAAAGDPARTPRRKPGPAPYLDKVRQREICAIVAVGCSRETAARYVGCCPTTIRRQAQRDPEFLAELQRAESLEEITSLRYVQAAARQAQYWRAAAWLLERKFPQRYAPRAAGSLTPEQVAQLLVELAEIVVAEVTDALLRRRILRRLKRLLQRVRQAAAPNAAETGAPP